MTCALALTLIIAAMPAVLLAQCCTAPDNGSGTVDFPTDCPYDNEIEPMCVQDGLPPGDTIELWGPLTDFHNVSSTPGGSLGGEICYFDAFLDWDVVGTGSLTGFSRHLYVPVTGEIHIAPRTPGDSIQVFEAKIARLYGELFGDPDFCTMRVLAGDDYGLSSPGQTTLTRLPNGDFAVDSFFDIYYQIEFEGCPDSQLSDLAGTTTDNTIKWTCWETSGVPEEPQPRDLPADLSLLPNRPNPFSSSTIITYAVPADGAGSRVTVKIFDIAGRVVSNLVDTSQPAGIYHVKWNGSDQTGRPVAPGVYFCRLTTAGEAKTQRIVYLR